MNENLENNLNTNVNFESEKKGKTKFLLVGFLLVIAIGVGLYFGYKKLNSNPVSIYKEQLNNIYKSLNKSLDEASSKSVDNIDITKEPIVMDIDATFTSSLKELKNFSGLNYHINTGVDLKNEKINVLLGIKDNKSSIINVVLSAINKNIYLKSEELYSKVLNLGEEDIFKDLDLSSNITFNDKKIEVNYDNYKYILKEIKDIIIGSLDKDKFTIKDNKITIANKEFKVKEVEYNLDKDNMTKTLNFIKSKILENDKLMNTLVSSLGITLEELKEALNEEIDMSSYKDTKIVLYTDKLNNVIAGKMLYDNNEIIKFDDIKDDLNIEFTSEGNVIKINKNKDDIVTLTGYENESLIMKLVIDAKKDLKIDYDLNIEGINANGKLEFTDINSSKDSMTSNLKLSLNAKALGETFDFAIDGKFSLEKKEVNTLNPSGSVSINDINETEAMEIFTKLSTILEKFGLSDLLGNM